jgi:hypothetical protein
LCESSWMPLPPPEHNLNRTTFDESKKPSFGRKKKLCITNYNFYAFLCWWYNYVLLVSCWISFFRCLLSASFVASYVNSSISSQHTAAVFQFKAIYSGMKAYSIKVEFLILFSGIVVIHGTIALPLTHRSAGPNVYSLSFVSSHRTLFFSKRNFYIILASSLLLLLLRNARLSNYTFLCSSSWNPQAQEPQPTFYNEISSTKISRPTQKLN